MGLQRFISCLPVGKQSFARENLSNIDVEDVMKSLLLWENERGGEEYQVQTDLIGRGRSSDEKERPINLQLYAVVRVVSSEDGRVLLKIEKLL